jgi:hypothetical protein
MILFDVRCSNDHVFEAWFKDSATFDRQRKKKQISCPACGDDKVEKALMAPNVSSKKEDSAESARRAASAMKMLYQMRKKIEENCEYVGPRFAEEARKIHYEEVEKRDIYGEATPDEAQSLRDEGVEFGEIPWVPRADA